MDRIPASVLLENDCVLLRKLCMEDISLLMPFAISEPETWNFSLTSAAGEEGMNQYLLAAIKDAESGYAFPFLVFDKKQNTVAGCTRYYDVNFDQLSVQIGYTWYGKAFRGTGLNKNCKYLLLQYAFETLGFERVEFRADANNQRSVAAMKSIGASEEGILRNHLFKTGGGRRDSIILSILREEWFGGVQLKLLQKTKNLL